MRMFVVLLLCFASLSTFAVGDDQRITYIAKNLRCLTCDNQSVFESGSDFSEQVFLEVDNLVKDGKSDEQIFQIMVDEYGDNILYSPTFNQYTFLLWLAPVLFVGFALYLFFRFYFLKSTLDV